MEERNNAGMGSNARIRHSACTATDAGIKDAAGVNNVGMNITMMRRTDR